MGIIKKILNRGNKLFAFPWSGSKIKRRVGRAPTLRLLTIFRKLDRK